MEQTDSQQYCTFWVHGRLYGVDILAVREITRQLDMTPVYHAHEAVKGYLNIRGRILLILDLSLLLGHGAALVSDSHSVVIFKPKVIDDCGVLVERIGDVETVNPEQVTYSSTVKTETGFEDNPLIKGVCRMDGQLLVLLHAGNLLDALSGMIKN